MKDNIDKIMEIIEKNTELYYSELVSIEKELKEYFKRKPL